VTTPQPIEIVGGGLAGLSLGTALARAGVPVTVHEALTFPRHRVCGEFIRGLDDATMRTLQLGPVLEKAGRADRALWFNRDRVIRSHAVRPAAVTLSRYELDARLAETFVRAGGILQTNHRVPAVPAPGRVLACGRAVARDAAWLGLKLHARDFTVRAGLEMHLGDRAYVGVCALPDGRVNLCGMFHRRAEIAAPRERLLLAYLRAAGLEELAARLARAAVDEESCAAVAALPLRPHVPREGVRIGDAFAMMPPFTGNGMALAFQSAALAVAPLLAWARREATWRETERAIRQRQRRRFGARLRLAGLLHPRLTSPRSQRWLVTATRAGVVPLGLLQRALS
jgi:flavin-dependent dehydrogenase